MESRNGYFYFSLFIWSLSTSVPSSSHSLSVSLLSVLGKAPNVLFFLSSFLSIWTHSFLELEDLCTCEYISGMLFSSSWLQCILLTVISRLAPPAEVFPDFWKLACSSLICCISSDPLRSRCQKAIRCARDFLGEEAGGAGEAEIDGESLQTVMQVGFCERWRRSGKGLKLCTAPRTLQGGTSVLKHTLPIGGTEFAHHAQPLAKGSGGAAARTVSELRSLQSEMHAVHCHGHDIWSWAPCLCLHRLVWPYMHILPALSTPWGKGLCVFCVIPPGPSECQAHFRDKSH